MQFFQKRNKEPCPNWTDMLIAQKDVKLLGFETTLQGALIRDTLEKLVIGYSLNCLSVCYRIFVQQCFWV